MSVRSGIAWTMQAPMQAYYGRKVDARVLEHARAHADVRAYTPEYYDLFRLVRFVRERKPQVLWEFGSGWSTCFLGQAVADNQTGILYSMEADADWCRNTRSMLSPDVQAWVELRHVVPERVTVGGECASKYPWRPPAVPQFIYVDGPAGAGKCPGNADILEIEEQLEPGCLIVLDSRQKTTEFLRRTLRRKWRSWEEMGPMGRALGRFRNEMSANQLLRPLHVLAQGLPIQRYFELER